MPNQTNAAIPANTSVNNLDPPSPTNSSTKSEKNQDNRSVYHDIDNGSPTRHKCESKSGGKLHAKKFDQKHAKLEQNSTKWLSGVQIHVHSSKVGATLSNDLWSGSGKATVKKKSGYMSQLLFVINQTTM